MSLDTCDFFVEVRLPSIDSEDHPNPLHPNHRTGWEELSSTPFLDAVRTPALARALYIPGVTTSKAVWGEYVVFQKLTAASPSTKVPDRRPAKRNPPPLDSVRDEAEL